MKQLGTAALPACFCQSNDRQINPTNIDHEDCMNKYTAVSLMAMASFQDVSAHEREILEVLRRRGGDAWALELLCICKDASPRTLRSLEQKRFIKISNLSI